MVGKGINDRLSKYSNISKRKMMGLVLLDEIRKRMCLEPDVTPLSLKDAEKRGKYYSVPFYKDYRNDKDHTFSGEEIRGETQVYGDKFIRVYLEIKNKEDKSIEKIFESVDDAIQYLDYVLLEGDIDKGELVPTREDRRRERELEDESEPLDEAIDNT